MIIKKTIRKLVVIAYFIIFYALSWGAVYLWITDKNEFKSIAAFALGLFLIFAIPASFWFFIKNKKRP
jgi:hypothetical protein